VEVRLYVLVRALAGGRFLAASADFPGLTAENESRDSAIAAVANELQRGLRKMAMSARAGLGRTFDPELMPVTVELSLGRKQAAAKITVDLIVVRRPTSGSDLFIGRVAGMPYFEVVVDSRTAIREIASRQLARELQEWRIESALALDAQGEAEFVEVELPLPPAVAHQDDDEDGEDVLAELGDDLTARAREGALATLDRRDELDERLLSVLASDGPSSALLVGPRDVGKTTLAYEVARRISRGDVPKPLEGRDVWRIPANELIAGARFTGMWQDRARRLVAQARSGDAILMMGDPVAIVDAGRWSGSDNNLARFLRTYIETGEITVICEATPESVTASHVKEPSFIDAMHRIEVPEPPAEHAVAILRDAAARLGARVGIPIDETAVSAAVELTRRYEPYRSLPGKAVHLLEETVRRGTELIRREDVVAAFAARSGLPHTILSDEAPLDLEGARRFFEERVLGQPEAIDAVLELLGVLKAGLNRPGKPLGTFFFVGPTGVGKTELAKALAEFLFGRRDRLLRFDMGEFSTRDAVPRLIGTAWQSEDEGELTRRVREQPFSVVLLDEIEKAHPDVFDVLLSALGEGRLTDSNGRTADFRNAIIIMTSNLGASKRQSGAVGFASDAVDERERLRTHYREQAQSFFRPEFVNRIDRVVAFDALDRDVVRRIARREVGRLLLRDGLVRRQLLVEVDDAAIDALAATGFDPQFGARPLQRQIEQSVISPLARLIVTRQPQPGDVVRLRVVDGTLSIELEPPPATPAERRDARRERRAAPARASAARAEEAVRELVSELDAEIDGAPAEALRLELSALIEGTQRPAFWDDPDDARQVMTRIYTLERVLERLARLHGRATGLIELARYARRTSDRARVPEVVGAVDEIRDGLELTRLELAGISAGKSTDPVVVRVTPIGGESESWADEVAAMYRAWAERTGREVTASADGATTLEIHGPATLELLLTECGIHRRRLADRRELDARVSIDESTGEAIVRVYEEGRRNVVRDPRTNTRSSSLDDVLRGGRLEQFLLAALRMRP
jgi:ATP-dependent Clp protease ATP-binding subunit ClpC